MHMCATTLADPFGGSMAAALTHPALPCLLRWCRDLKSPNLLVDGAWRVKVAGGQAAARTLALTATCPPACLRSWLIAHHCKAPCPLCAPRLQPVQAAGGHGCAVHQPGWHAQPTLAGEWRGWGGRWRWRLKWVDMNAGQVRVQVRNRVEAQSSAALSTARRLRCNQPA